MTFLLQKFTATARTRAEARARNGLRSSGGGAFTSRLAACLLLAGFLGVGPAMAQPLVLRVGFGNIDVSPPTSSHIYVHHYVIDTDADGDFDDEPATSVRQNPGDTFFIGGAAFIRRNATTGVLTVQPVAPIRFKIAMDTAAWASDAPTDGRPVEFEIESSLAPGLVVTAVPNYNTAANAANVGESLTLVMRETESHVYDNVGAWFNDPNEIFLSYDAQADMIKGGVGTERLDKVDKDGIHIVTAELSGSSLTVSLADSAMVGDRTDIWVFARDGGGEYARRQIRVAIGRPTAPQVADEPQGEIVLREDSTDPVSIPMPRNFTDPDLTSYVDAGDMSTGTRDAVNGDVVALSYEVEVVGVPPFAGTGGDNTTWFPPSLRVDRVPTDTLRFTPRAAGETTIKITATDFGSRCRGFTYVDRGGADDPATPDLNEANGYCHPTGGDVAASRIGTYSGRASTSHEFKVVVITRTTPAIVTGIPNLTGDHALDAETRLTQPLDLSDLDSSTDGAQPAFSGDGLTYEAVVLKNGEEMTGQIDIDFDGSMMNLTPVWRSGDETFQVSVTATNNLDETGPESSTFNVTVRSARSPVVNQNALVQGQLAQGFTLNAGDEPLVVHLLNLTNEDLSAEGATPIPLFIDPDANPTDLLPGGLLIFMRVGDVAADHVYANLSQDNDVQTSAMRLTVHPSAPDPTLTIRPTAPNSATVTLRAIDREFTEVSATTTITVESGVGADGEELPTEVGLSQNYPNPFNPQTAIEYALPQAGDVSLVVYDMLGRQVDVLLDGPQAAGFHMVRFGASHLPNGTYVYRLVAGEKTITRTMVLVK